MNVQQTAIIKRKTSPTEQRRADAKKSRVKAPIGNTDVIYGRDLVGPWMEHPWLPGGGVRILIEGTTIHVEQKTATGQRQTIAKLRQHHPILTIRGELAP